MPTAKARARLPKLFSDDEEGGRDRHMSGSEVRSPPRQPRQEPARARRAPRPLAQGCRELRAGLAQRSGPRRAPALLPPFQAQRGARSRPRSLAGNPGTVPRSCARSASPTWPRKGRFCWFFTGRLEVRRLGRPMIAAATPAKSSSACSIQVRWGEESDAGTHTERPAGEGRARGREYLRDDRMTGRAPGHQAPAHSGRQPHADEARHRDPAPQAPRQYLPPGEHHLRAEWAATSPRTRRSSTSRPSTAPRERAQRALRRPRDHRRARRDDGLRGGGLLARALRSSSSGRARTSGPPSTSAGAPRPGSTTTMASRSIPWAKKMFGLFQHRPSTSRIPSSGASTRSSWRPIRATPKSAARTSRPRAPSSSSRSPRRPGSTWRPLGTAARST